MTLPKKGLRKITVENIKYAWSVIGNDGWIGLSVIPLKVQNNLLTASFDYHSRAIERTVTNVVPEVIALRQQLVITAYIARQVILYALSVGWEPNVKGAILNLGGMDDKVDLRCQYKDIISSRG